MKQIYHTKIISVGTTATCTFWTDTDPYKCKIWVEGNDAEKQLKFILSREGKANIIEV